MEKQKENNTQQQKAKSKFTGNTNEFFKQSSDFGKKMNLNLTRLELYQIKMSRMYKILGKDEIWVYTIKNGTVTDKQLLTEEEALKMITTIGKEYFVEIYYTDCIKVVVTGRLPDEVLERYQKKETAQKEE